MRLFLKADVLQAKQLSASQWLCSVELVGCREWEKCWGGRTARNRAYESGKLSRYRHAGDKGEKSYSSYLLLTSALDRGWVVSVTLRPRFTPGERHPVPIG
jgi:hypothetical protein